MTALAICLITTAPGAASNCSGTSTGLVPLTDLGTGTYRGEQGGLYPNGSNVRPEAHEHAGVEIARRIRPLDANGYPSDDGKVVLLSIGMSNTTQEFSTFIPRAYAEPDLNPDLVIVDGAQAGMTASDIVDLDSSQGQQFWERVAARLADAGVTPAQVQTAWIKQAERAPTEPFPEDARILQGDLEQIVVILADRFPNLQLAYLSSRTYAGYASTALNPEPYAYQSGFAVKWLIEKQIAGAPELNFDPARGEVRAPWLAWGPYLWADGLAGRSDGLVYTCADFANDGTHPAPGGARDKVAQLLIDFFTSDSTAREWFLGASVAPSVTVTSPNGGEKARRGETLMITWSVDASADLVGQTILLSPDSGQTFPTIIASEVDASARSFEWQIPRTMPKGATYRIRVEARDEAGSTSSDDSDADFRIKRRKG